MKRKLIQNIFRYEKLVPVNVQYKSLQQLAVCKTFLLILINRKLIILINQIIIKLSNVNHLSCHDWQEIWKNFCIHAYFLICVSCFSSRLRLVTNLQYHLQFSFHLCLNWVSHISSLASPMHHKVGINRPLRVVLYILLIHSTTN